jgi:hypothetical protein
MEKPLVEFLWDSMFNAIHHRGQLSAYLRPRGRVPSIYGPSADERGCNSPKNQPCDPKMLAMDDEEIIAIVPLLS